MSKHRYHFKAGDSVLIYNGGKLEGRATIKKRLGGYDDYYSVVFDSDAERGYSDLFSRWVAPEWQAPGFKVSYEDAYNEAPTQPPGARWIGSAVLLLTLTMFPFVAHAAKAPRHVTRPISNITVKVMPAEKLAGKPWRITTSDADSCTAWVSEKAPSVPTAQLNAFIACQGAILRVVKGGAR